MTHLGRIVLLSLLACALPGAQPCMAAEENIRTPSDQMKEAVGKVGKAPATIGKSLQDLTDAAKEKLRETFGGGKGTAETKDKPADLALPKKTTAAPAAPVRMNESYRDPFRPLTLRTKAPAGAGKKRENLSPLERLELSQSALSQHLARLRQERLVTFRRQSQTIHYKVSDPRAEDVLALLSDLFCPELAQPVTESSASRSIPGRGRARGGGKG